MTTVEDLIEVYVAQGESRLALCIAMAHGRPLVPVLEALGIVRPVVDRRQEEVGYSTASCEDEWLMRAYAQQAAQSEEATFFREWYQEVESNRQQAEQRRNTLLNEIAQQLRSRMRRR